MLTSKRRAFNKIFIYFEMNFGNLLSQHFIVKWNWGKRNILKSLNIFCGWLWIRKEYNQNAFQFINALFKNAIVAGQVENFYREEFFQFFLTNVEILINFVYTMSLFATWQKFMKRKVFDDLHVNIIFILVTVAYRLVVKIIRPVAYYLSR